MLGIFDPFAEQDALPDRRSMEGHIHRYEQHSRLCGPELNIGQNLRGGSVEVMVICWR